MWRHAKIIIGMKNPYDYEEYCSLVELPEEKFLYAQRVGLTLFAQNTHPDDSIDVAQNKVAKERNTLMKERQEEFKKLNEPNSVIVGKPTLLNKAKGLGRAVVDHAKNGFKNASKEVYNKRMEICKSCKYSKKLGENTICKSCGCLMDIKAKWEEQKCINGKW